MKNTELKVYASIIKQGLSNRAAARLLKLPVATARYRLCKYKQTGALIHGNTGKQNRKPSPDKKHIIQLVFDRYCGFGISHSCELLLERDGIAVNRETLRRWLNRPKTHKAPKQRQRREASPNFGDLLQIDGSFDCWFGNDKSCLMHIVDDATNTAELRFEQQETIESACYCAWEWFNKYGVPKAFYADGRNMYHLNPDSEHNFFTNMCENLGIRVILAHSAQAKGRVERWNGIQQRRLIPLLHLDKVQDMENANKYLEKYIVEHNKKYAHKPAVGDSHKPLQPDITEIDDVCFILIERTLKSDWTFSYKGKIYQLPRQSDYPPAKAKIKVKITISGKITAYYRWASFNVR
jgi:transposase